LEFYRICTAFDIALQRALIRIRHKARSILAPSMAESGKICGAGQESVESFILFLGKQLKQDKACRNWANLVQPTDNRTQPFLHP
jgi:hypothetical protein